MAAGPAAAITVAETVALAVASNPDVEIVKSDRRAVDQELRQARSRYLPSLDLRAAAGGEISDTPASRNRGSNSSDTAERWRYDSQLRLSQILFDGFERRAEVERQEARVDSASFRVAEAAEFVGVDAVEAHFEVLRNAAIIELNEDHVRTHERILGNVRELEEAGRGDIADVRQTEARLAAAVENLARAEGDYLDAIALYERVVGEVPGTLEIEDPPLADLPAGSAVAARIASVQSPTVLIAASDVDVFQAELFGSRAGYYPQLDLEFTAERNHDVDGVSGNETTGSALVVLTYNLYRGGADIAREREAFHRLNEARADLQRVRRRAEEEARVSFNAYEVAVARAAALRDRVVAQRRTRDAYVSQFEIGQRDLLDVLDAENELFLARVQLVTAEFTERFAVYRLLGVLGALLNALDIAAPKETINISRTPEAAPTPERVEQKSRLLEVGLAKEAPLKNPAAGAPPPGAADVATPINAPLRPPQPEPATPPAPATPQDSSHGRPESGGFGAFWRALTSRPPR